MTTRAEKRRIKLVRDRLAAGRIPPQSVFVCGEEIKPDDHVIGVWYVYGKEPRNWLATLWRTADGGHYRLVHRFRYVVDDKLGDDSDDDKSIYSTEIPTSDITEAVMIEGLELVIKKMFDEGFNDRRDYIEVRGSATKMIKFMMKRPWYHLSFEKKETDA